MLLIATAPPTFVSEPGELQRKLGLRKEDGCPQHGLPPGGPFKERDPQPAGSPARFCFASPAPA